MFVYKLYRANRAIHRLETALVQQGYQTGYYDLLDHSRDWTVAQVQCVAQYLAGHRGSSATVQAQIGRLEDRIAKERAVVRAMRAQVDLRPPILSRARLHLSAWAASRRAGQLERQLRRLARTIDHILEREQFIERWSTRQIAALQQTYLSAFYPSRKGREYMVQLDSEQPPSPGLPIPANPLKMQGEELNGSAYPSESTEDRPEHNHTSVG